MPLYRATLALRGLPGRRSTRLTCTGQAEACRLVGLTQVLRRRRSAQGTQCGHRRVVRISSSGITHHCLPTCLSSVGRRPSLLRPPCHTRRDLAGSWASRCRRRPDERYWARPGADGGRRGRSAASLGGRPKACTCDSKAGPRRVCYSRRRIRKCHPFTCSTWDGHRTPTAVEPPAHYLGVAL